MAVKIRLQRKGRKQSPFYHIVIANSRSPRDGRFIEKIGTYNPMTKPATIEIDRDKAYQWLMKGAQPTDTVRAILRFKGVLYKKHLMLGVQKGALTQEEADEKLKVWIDAKESRIAARVEQSRLEMEAFYAKMAGFDGSFEVEKATEEAEEAAKSIMAGGEAAMRELNAVEEQEEAIAEETEQVVETIVEAAQEVVETTEQVAEATTEAAQEVVEVVAETKE